MRSVILRVASFKNWQVWFLKTAFHQVVLRNYLRQVEIPDNTERVGFYRLLVYLWGHRQRHKRFLANDKNFPYLCMVKKLKYHDKIF